LAGHLEGSLGFGATFVRRFGREFWQGILEGSLYRVLFIILRQFSKLFPHKLL